MKQIAPMLGAVLPMFEPYMPEFMNGVSSFLPEWMKDMAKKHNAEKIVIILDTAVQNDKTIAVIKFMTPINGKLEPVKKEDGSPYVEPASKLLSDLVNMGIDHIKNAPEAE